MAATATATKIIVKYMNAAPDMKNFRKVLQDYFDVVDEHVRRVSHMNEGVLAFMPSWFTSFREIRWGVNNDDALRLVAIRIKPDDKIKSDNYIHIPLNSVENGKKIIEPIHVNWEAIRQGGYLEPSWNEDASITYTTENLLDNVQSVLPGVSCVCGFEHVQGYFSDYAAKRFVEASWEAASERANSKHFTYADKLRRIIAALRYIIKTTTADERRIHRYINYHRSLLLPAHEECYFEHPIYKEDKIQVKYKADFVLDMGTGNRALLIELENQKHKIFRKNGHFRSEITHAVAQTKDWSKAITEFPHLNATGDFRFLLGEQDRMVVVGTGTKDEKRLNDTKQDDATVLTYDLLINNAVKQLNRKYEADCKLHGIADYDLPLEVSREDKAVIQ